MMKKNVYRFLILNLILFSFTGCIFNSASSKLASVEQKKQVLKELVLPNGSTIDEVKSGIKDEINQINWFEGSESPYFEFQNKDFFLELYVNTKHKESVTAVLENNNYYYSLDFDLSDKGYNLNGLYVSLSKGEIVEELESAYYKLFLKEKINFSKVKKPNFIKFQPSIVKTIKELLLDSLKSNNFKKGNYKIYIKPFLRNDDSTVIVIEKGKNIWLTYAYYYSSIELDNIEDVSDNYKAKAISKYKKYGKKETIYLN